MNTSSFVNPLDLPHQEGWWWWWLLLLGVVVPAVLGNLLVCVAVAWDPRLRRTGTNKLIASLAFSDFLVGALVMPFALHTKVGGDEWRLSEGLCRFHLSTAAFFTTASIIHLVAISIDRYFAIIFPTEYQRHSTQTSTGPYIVIMWVLSGLISATALLEPLDTQHRICWLQDPQYLILSSLMSFVLPASVVCYLYVKIFRKLRQHLALSFSRKRGPTAPTSSLPQVVVEEVCSRRGSWLSSRDRSNSAGSKGSRSSARSASQPDIGPDILELATIPARFRSPTICETTLNARGGGAESPPNDPPLAPLTLVPPTTALLSAHSKRKISAGSLWKRALSRAQQIRTQQPRRSRAVSSRFSNGGDGIRAELRTPLMDKMTSLQLPSSKLLAPAGSARPQKKNLLAVPETPGSLQGSRHGSIAEDGDSFASAAGAVSVSTGSSRSSDDVRSSVVSFGSSLTEDTDYGSSSRRASALSSVSSSKRRISGMSPGKLRAIASQVTRAIRRKRRESAAIRRETRATRLVAAILVVFVLCWLPFFCAAIARGVALGVGVRLDPQLHIRVYLLTAWLGYFHSCANPVIYTCLNRNFRRTFKKFLRCGNSKSSASANVFSNDDEDDP